MLHVMFYTHSCSGVASNGAGYMGIKMTYTNETNHYKVLFISKTYVLEGGDGTLKKCIIMK